MPLPLPSLLLLLTGRYLLLNAVANQLRYPNSHTHYFSCCLLALFSETNTEAIQEQITRQVPSVLPWGLVHQCMLSW